MRTRNCIKCGRPAIMWSGHVIRINDDKSMKLQRLIWDVITAGWCSKKCMDTIGFCGQYTENMGVEID